MQSGPDRSANRSGLGNFSLKVVLSTKYLNIYIYLHQKRAVVPIFGAGGCLKPQERVVMLILRALVVVREGKPRERARPLVLGASLVVVREGKPRKQAVVLVFGAGGCQKVVETPRMRGHA